MKSILVTISLLFALSLGIAQEVQLDSEEYRALKNSGELLNGSYTIANPNEGVSDHVTVQPSVAGEREGECDCWIEPDNTYTLANFGAQGTDDGSTNNIAFPFNFLLYGTAYTSMWINTNGNVTFDGANATYTASGFPNNDVMLAPFWADVDFGCGDCGDLYYKVTDDAVFVNWIEVGYFSGQNDKVNSFQVIFTPEGSEVLTAGNTAQFCYLDMQWTTGSASQGTNGFGGSPANVGASAGNNNDFISFGEFDQEGDDYDGPFATTDGVSWLDDQTITFNANISANENLPPLVLGDAGGSCGDTLVLCANDTEIIELTFLAPENNQTMEVTFEDGGFPDISINATGGSTATVTAILNSDTTPGFYNISFTATDNGTPPLSTTVTYVVEVLDIEVPDLDIYFEGDIVNAVSYCQGQDGVTLSGTDGFDSYLWSNDLPLQTSSFNQGIYTLTAFIEGCDTQAGPVTVFEIPVFNPGITAQSLFLCEGETTEITLDDADDYTSIAWAVVDGDGNIISEDTEQATIEVGPGLYQVTVTDDGECPGNRIIQINEEIVNVPNVNFLAQCDEDDLIEWTGAWADPNTCVYPIYLYDSEGDSWEGANVEVYVDGTGPLNYNISGSSGFSADGFNVFHGQLIEYFFTSGLDDDDIRVQIYNTNSVVVFDTDEGDLLIDNGLPFFTQQANCGFNALPGTWEVNVPAGGEGYTLEYTDVFNPVNDDNVFTAPLGFVGTYDLTFTSDVCDRVEEVSLTFSVTPTVEAFDYEQCDNEGVSIEPVYGPSDVIDDATYTWIPNNLGSGPTAETSSSINYIIEIENVCGNSQDQGEIIIVPTPTAILFNDVLCDGATSILSPSGQGDPSWVFDWSTGEDTPSIQVSSANDYSVTVSNNCGTAQASAFINTSNSPTVTYLTDTLFYCAGDVQTIAPTWTGGTPFAAPITWELEYLDADGAPFTETLSSSETSIQVGSDQIPPPADEATLTFTANDYCGTAQEEVVLQLIPCFIQAPNVITPDSDGETAGYFSGGLNEAWFIEGIERLQNVQVRIFNRWGNLVYENDNYSNNNPWDGKTTKGDELEDGVYFYTITASENIDPVEGTVTIFRK